MTPYLEARDSIKSQLEDLAFFLRRYADDIDASPVRLQEVDDRLIMLERLKRKYGPTLGAVLAHRDEAVQELEDAGRAGCPRRNQGPRGGDGCSGISRPGGRALSITPGGSQSVRCRPRREPW